MPDAAIVYEGDTARVWVARDDRTIEARSVKTGRTEAGLVEIRDRAAAKGARRISIEVFVGEPAERILACANARQADLIAIGSRGHGRLVGLLLGSIAQKVVALARCAVLVVH